MNLESLLDARPSRREDLGAWYSSLLAAAEREGATVPQLAEQLGCSHETVYAWKRRLAKKPDGASGSPAATLVRVRVTDSPAEPDVGRLEIRVCGGRSILVPSDFDVSTLAAVVAVLERC